MCTYKIKKRNKNNTQVKIIVINSNNNDKWMILRICSDCTVYSVHCTATDKHFAKIKHQNELKK